MKNTKGFTMVELLVTIVIIGVLASIVVVSTAAVKQRTRNAQRSTDISTILSSVYNYALDNSNQFPATITTTPTDICITGAASCTGLIDLSVLTTNQKYLPSMPIDPLGTSTNDTHYAISKNSYGRITISAPFAEAGQTISVTR